MQVVRTLENVLKTCLKDTNYSLGYGKIYHTSQLEYKPLFGKLYVKEGGDEVTIFNIWCKYNSYWGGDFNRALDDISIVRIEIAESSYKDFEELIVKIETNIRSNVQVPVKVVLT